MIRILKEAHERILVGSSWHRWLVIMLLCAFCSDRKRQRSITDECPTTFRQRTKTNDAISSLLSSTLLRSIRPSLFEATRCYITSLLPFFKSFPPPHRRLLRESIVIGGAKVVTIEWELPSEGIFKVAPKKRAGYSTKSADLGQDVVTQADVLHGSIKRPVILVVDGADSSSAYVRSSVRTFTDQGWIVAALFSTGSKCCCRVTKDLRSIVQQISTRLAPTIPIFLVGSNSGGNLIMNYLGEEGLRRKLPPTVAGGVALSNPFTQDLLLKAWLSRLLRIGRVNGVTCDTTEEETPMHRIFQASSYDGAAALSSVNGEDRAVSSYPASDGLQQIRDENICQGKSNFHHVQHISVPVLMIGSHDDMFVHRNIVSALRYCRSNPNLIVATTRSGRHPDFRVAPVNKPCGNTVGAGGRNWAESMTLGFIEAIIRMSNFERNTARHLETSDNESQTSSESAPRSISPSSLRSRL